MNRLRKRHLSPWRISPRHARARAVKLAFRIACRFEVRT